MYQVTQWQFETNEVRTLVIDGEPYFVGKDIAQALGYKNTKDALARHIDAEDKAGVVIHDGSQKRTMTAINESGVYALIFSSELPTAKKFKRWVTSEVLPAIRRTGSYNIVPAEPVNVMLLPSMQNYIAQLNDRPHFPESACKVVIQNFFRKYVGFAPSQDEIQISETSTNISEKNGIVESVSVRVTFSIGTRKYHMRASNHDYLDRNRELECETIQRLDNGIQGII